MSPTTLYRLYDNDDVLLYVGISTNPFARWHGHKHDKVWWHHVRKCTLEPYPDRHAALTAEKQAIKAERPVHNIKHNNKRGKMADNGQHSNSQHGNGQPERHPLLYRYVLCEQGGGRQGQIVSVVDSSLVLVEWFSWLTGAATHSTLVDLTTAVEDRWHLFDDHQDFLDAGDAMTERNLAIDRRAAKIANQQPTNQETR